MLIKLTSVIRGEKSGGEKRGNQRFKGGNERHKIKHEKEETNNKINTQRKKQITHINNGTNKERMRQCDWN